MKHQLLPSDSRKSSVTAYSNRSGLMTSDVMLSMVTISCCSTLTSMTKSLISVTINRNQTTNQAINQVINGDGSAAAVGH